MTQTLNIERQLAIILRYCYSARRAAQNMSANRTRLTSRSLLTIVLYQCFSNFSARCPQLKYIIFCRPRGLAQQLLIQGIYVSNCSPSYCVAYCCSTATSLTTAELRHMHYNIVCDVTNRTVFILSSQWMI